MTELERVQSELPTWQCLEDPDHNGWTGISPQFALDGVTIKAVSSDDLIAKVRIYETMCGLAILANKKLVLVEDTPSPRPVSDQTPQKRAKRKIAVPPTRSSEFTGEICAYCQGTSMRRSGKCSTCATCGETSGCS